MKELLKKFIVSNFMYDQGTIADDEQLFESGIIDSLGFIKLLAFIEEKLKVSIDMSEVTMDKFSTINDMMKTIESKMHK
ncbi:MAG: acyl carrier protein [bacterium]|mgnify:CR=1 FL=1